ncbi:cytochrome P450 [Macrolepiota fuliginosa MF-IS2]|uniref:Cytochrome P450 n=1 Tax=Macrolepiota fuliginosa MF-IS2 TaxID=1400762 RepID=A0A9P5X897_9AGAR|nr:cytochrome P450 [Macrolepiota fuliginosa MF-IS2]
MASLTDIPPLARYAVLLVLAAGFASRYFTSSRSRLPPGPRPLPFIGNILQIRAEHPEEGFAEWGAKYGDVVRLRMFSQTMIILNSLEAARDLLDKRSSIYSDRPRFVLFSELMGWKHATTHLRYGHRFRKHRRWINNVFNAHAIPQFRPLQTKETLVLLTGMIQEPENFVKHFKRYAAATILKVTYNRNVQSIDDLLVRIADKAATLTVESGSPAATLVDFFPLMRFIPTWLPFAGFKRKALETRSAVDAMFRVPFDLVKEDMKSGKAGASYVSTLIEKFTTPDGQLSVEDECDIQGTAGTLYAAAEDTTVSLLHTFVMAMVLYPQVYKKLQAEMDSVTGTQRLPNFDDRPSLPYLECVLKEILRWNVPVPLGMPHRLMEDDIYRNFYIPAGSSVLVNIHSILQDCEKPNEFIPERYMENPDLPDPHTVIFGFGRRICPGRHFSEESLWSISAHMIATMDISKAKDENGADITPPLEFTTGFVSHPKPFNCIIRSRSDQVMTIIQEAQANTGEYVFPIDSDGRIKQ